jgi:hypothetical protein
MKPIPNATISSIYSSALGCVVILLWASVTALMDANETLEALSSISGALLIYSVSVVVVFALAFLVGSPIYYVLFRLGIANYFSSSVLGAAFVLVIFGVGGDQIYWLLAGIATGCFYHYVYTKHRKI